VFRKPRSARIKKLNPINGRFKAADVFRNRCFSEHSPHI
jgi:hypothetical protein